MSSFNREVVDDLSRELVARLPNGRDLAIQGRDLASEMGISERMVRAVIEHAIDDGYLIGSVCSGEHPGYFRCVTIEDVEAGCGHLVSRARSLNTRVRALRDAAAAQFRADPEVLRLFDPDMAQNTDSTPLTAPAATG